MCGRFVAASTPAELAEEFHVDEIRTQDLGARYNVAPSLDVYTVATTSDGERRLGALAWGLIPSFADDPKIANKMINLRADTVLKRPAFTRLLERRRCIVPADGFYEWQRKEPERAGDKPVKQPFYIHAADGGSLGFAALWDRWQPRDDPDAEPRRTVTLITGEPNDLVASIHNRMVVMLPRDKWDLWLDPGAPFETVRELLVGIPDDQIAAYPVTTAVNNVKNEGRELIEPKTSS